MSQLMNSNTNPPIADFVRTSTWHGDIKKPEAIIKIHPELRSASIHIAAILGDFDGVQRWIAADASNVFAKAPPYDAAPLVLLCMSNYLRLEPGRSDDFLRGATALLDAGADPNGGFWVGGQYPSFESPLYGAAGV